jgi:hypothetical protein
LSLQEFATVASGLLGMTIAVIFHLIFHLISLRLESSGKEIR